ncbi:uncharacterized protein LOC106151854 [Lingula anatina]|uniref:Uncharacterized protein LOC106151854 n=1 Tax=Lingula anatina TaxID=7574 RepID=A0A1S3H5J3_LINAN|nr:uncharacterized protein LOC106151854 [Lingula anatina]|eukprot:XP_013380731.1 uncharacterized protein LOC106151854 [Lingula anatina]
MHDVVLDPQRLLARTHSESTLATYEGDNASMYLADFDDQGVDGGPDTANLDDFQGEDEDKDVKRREQRIKERMQLHALSESGSSEDEGEEERDHEINEVFQANRPEEIELPEPGKGKAPSSVSSTEEKENAADSRRPRSLSRSFEEYSDMYEEYKPPKKYVKPPVKEDKGPKTVIVTDTHRTSSPNSLDNNDQSNDHSEDVSEDENAGQVDTGPHIVQTTYSSTSNGGLHTFGASQVAVPKKADRTSLSSQPDDTPRELVRSEDHQDDGLESCPSLGNLKSKFDGPGAKAPPPPQVMATKKSTGPKASGPSSVSSASSPSEQGTPSSGEERELLRENLGEKEEVINNGDKDTEESKIHFEGMKDIMSKWQTGDVIRGEGSYQRDATDLDEVRKAKSAGSFKSKFDAPGNKPLAYEAYVPVVKEKEEPVQQIERPKPVNVDMEDNHEAELPPPSHTKNLLAKFKEIQTGGTVPTYDRKPPKRITPPREDQQLAHQDSDEENEAPQDPNLVRSGDKANAEEALPPAGFAKNLLGKFRSLEEQAANQPPPTPERTKQTQKFAVNAQRTTYNYSAFVVAPAVNPDKPREKTPEFEAGIFENKPVKTVEDYEQQIESGEYESNPEVQDGVAREGSRIVETEFPEYGYTKNVLARFKSMQEEAAKKESENVVLRKKSEVSEKPKPVKGGVTRTSLSKTPHSESRDSVHSVESLTKSDSSSLGSIPDRYHQEHGQNHGEVVREVDRNDENELPEHGLTKNLLAKFKTLEHDNPDVPLPTTPKSSSDVTRLTPREVRISSASHASSHWKHDDAHSDTSSITSDHPPRDSMTYSSDSGQYEDSPDHSQKDIMYNADSKEEDDLPPPNMTKNLLAKFQGLEG